MNTTTTNLADFGARERKMLCDLLTAWNEQGLPDDFDSDGVVPMLNTQSGYVFLTNDNCDVAMMNGDNLEMWYVCPYCGHEGFKDDMAHDPASEECTEYLAQIGVVELDEAE